MRGIERYERVLRLEKARLLGNALADAFSVPLARGQHELIQRQIDQIAEFPDNFRSVVRVVVADATGRIVAHTDPTRFGDQWLSAPTRTEEISEEVSVDGPVVVLRLPIATALLFGTIEVAVTSTESVAAAREATFAMGVTLAVVLVLVVLILTGVLNRLVVLPLRRLSNAVQRYTGTAPTLGIVPAGPLEVRLLLEAFDEMARRLHGARGELERTVDERTKELRGAYDRLTLANRQLQELAVTDGLTGLANRRAFTDRLQLEVDRARRTKSPLSLVLFDLDHFKKLNDTLGHLEGDAALVLLSALLREDRRAADLIARYGGEEFTLLLPDTPHAEALVVAERMRRATANGGLPGNCTVSAGVATMPEHADDGRSLVALADRALYAAKDAGRNRIMSAGAVPPSAPDVPVPP